MLNASSYADWVGRTREAVDVLTLHPALTVASILPQPPDIAVGEKLPPLWHWLYFPEIVPLAQTGLDGHPKRGDFLPPVALPRRMWAGGQISFLSDLRFGETVRRRSKIVGVTHKDGKSGTLCFVTVQHSLLRGDTLCLQEQQDIVYREAANSSQPAPEPNPLPDADRREMIVPSSVMLFRFSSATSNSHRIHYDRTYAQDEEHYGGLVVHGPLTATLLADLACRTSGRSLASFSFRGLRPLLDTAPFTIAVSISGDDVALRAEGPDGNLAMKAEAELARQ
jgi:3-methylfumaryl-CoA hydratase